MRMNRPRQRLNLESLESRITPSAGDLDPTFGSGGVQILNLSPYTSDFGLDTVVQPDGKIVIAGVRHDWPTSDGVLVRLNPDGSLDSSFDGDGIVALDALGYEQLDFRALTLQSDGKIVATGSQHSWGQSTSMGLIARFMPDGSLDTSFGSGGVVLTAIQPNDIAVQNDGKIVIGGSVDGPNPSLWSPSPAAARFLADGSIDTSFSSDGVAVGPIDSSEALTLLIQPDGKILLGGYTTHAYSPFVLVRFDVDGNLDESFDGDGLVTTTNHLANYGGEIRALALDADGRILAAGVISSGLNGYPSLFRYLPNGSLDSAFDGDGRTYLDVPNTLWSANEAVAIQADGKVVVAGELGIPGGSLSSISRYNSDGSLDETFAAAEGSPAPGVVAIDVAPDDMDVFFGLVIQADGKIVAVGRAGGGSEQNFAIVRLEGTFVSTAAPTLDPLSATLDENGFTFTAVGHDADVGDILTYSLTEAPEGAVIDPQTGLFNWTPGEDQLGSYTVTVRVTDRGGMYAEQSITLTTLGMDGERLIYVGSAGNDVMAFVEGAPGEITVLRDGVAVGQFASVKRIVAYGMAGNDVLATNAALACTFYGGTGSDKLQGGRGCDSLFGGKGADQIVGGLGADCLMGGRGIDLLCGGRGSDILMGGAGCDRMIDGFGANRLDWSPGELQINLFGPLDARWQHLEKILSWRIWDLAGGVTFAPPLP